jgi:hypothetical protein
MLFTNKEDFKNNAKVYTILTALETAHANKDHFSASILLTRLENENITLSDNIACDKPENELQ